MLRLVERSDDDRDSGHHRERNWPPGIATVRQVLDVSVVILTMGDRPTELAAAIASARAQRDVQVEIVVVGNGVAVPENTDADLIVELAENVGIPGGRNAGVEATAADLVLLLDDDGDLLGGDVVASACDLFVRDPRLAVVGLGIVDDAGGRSRRHSPRLRHPSAGLATSFPGGGSIVRRDAFLEVGGFAEQFFYALEETDLAWRLLDAGWVIRYEPELLMRHPRTSPTRHPSFVERTARNRVWLAHRSLPFAVAIAYVAVWSALTIARARFRPSIVRSHLVGTLAGLRAPIGPRRPMSWRTAWLMTTWGRPPLI